MRRDGFTLVEVMMALVILLVVVLGMAEVTGRMLHTITTSDRRVAAEQLAEDRLEAVRLDQDYTNLSSSFAGTESSFPTLPGFTRTTVVDHVGGAGLEGPDYTKVTVTVAGPGLLAPLSRTVTVAAP
jgi:prepilin-type N-terminal cleavage/methylation domain-containing protein